MPYGQPAYDPGQTTPYSQPAYQTGEQAPYGQPDQYAPPGAYLPPGAFPPAPPGYPPGTGVAAAPGGKPPSGGKGPIVALIIGAAVVLIGVVVAVLFLTGVLGGKDQGKAGGSTTSPTPKATQTEAPPTPTQTDGPIEPTELPTEQPDYPGGYAEADLLTFGEWAVWDDGMEVQVGAPQEYTPDETNAGFTGTGTALRFTVTFNNNSSVSLEPIMFFIEMISAGQDSERIFDTAMGIDLPTDPVLPGEALVWDVAFEVADPSDVSVGVAPGWQYNTVYFE